MKRLLTSIAALGLMAWGAEVANADLLINGDMNLVSISSQNNPTVSRPSRGPMLMVVVRA
jgi:hypothetical protein